MPIVVHTSAMWATFRGFPPVPERLSFTRYDELQSMAAVRMVNNPEQRCPRRIVNIPARQPDTPTLDDPEPAIR
ncbi:MAG TPA: hypothetical protein VGM03_10130, partial [Phycisphaerae bacterium]